MPLVSAKQITPPASNETLRLSMKGLSWATLWSQLEQRVDATSDR
jgi:hypothetical protein